jgi:hypothetical protein
MRSALLVQRMDMTFSLFHEPWWLDAAAPGSWQQASVSKDGRQVARLPYAEQRVLGFRLLVTPPLVARLGPAIDLEEMRYGARLRRYDELVNELLDQLPAADLVQQVLHPETEQSWLPFYRRGFTIEPRISYVIDSIRDLDQVWRNMSGDSRTKIKAAGKALVVERDDTAERLDRMVRATFRRQHRGLPFDPDTIHRVTSECVRRDQGTILTAVDASGAVHASLFCAWGQNRAWYLLGGGDPELRSSQAGSLLIWQSIKEAAGRADRYDFEGSMLPNIAEHFRRLGGRQETYFVAVKTSRRFRPLWDYWRRNREAARLPSGQERLLARALHQMADRVRGARGRG